MHVHVVTLMLVTLCPSAFLIQAIRSSACWSVRRSDAAQHNHSTSDSGWSYQFLGNWPFIYLSKCLIHNYHCLLNKAKDQEHQFKRCRNPSLVDMSQLMTDCITWLAVLKFLLFVMIYNNVCLGWDELLLVKLSEVKQRELIKLLKAEQDLQEETERQKQTFFCCFTAIKFSQ